MLRHPSPLLLLIHWGRGGFEDGLMDGWMDGERGLAASPALVSITLSLPQPQTWASLFLEIFVKCSYSFNNSHMICLKNRKEQSVNVSLKLTSH